MMANGKQRFVLKAVVGLVVLTGLLVPAVVSVEATTARFGNLGWLHWLLGLASLVAGLIVAWSSVISFLDWRALRAHRADPDDALSDGQTVALSGRVRIDGQPLSAPFSDKPCACFTYQVTGQRRKRGGGSTDYRQQLCLLGFHLLPAVLESGSRRFPLLAIPDVDADLRSIAMGGAWGERGLERIRSGAEAWPQTEEADARGALEEARSTMSAPQSVDLFVAPTQKGANQVSIQEDLVPVDTPVTILATYDAGTRGLDGRRPGGMKVFLSDLDERVGELAREWHKGLKVAPPLLAAGLALMSLAWWWPA